MAIRHHSTITDVDQPPFESTDVLAGNMIVTPMGEHIQAERTQKPVQEQWIALDAERGSFGLGLGGFIALLLGAWVALVPFIGPTFGFSLDGTSSWTWTSAHLYGALLPGVVAVLASMIVMGSASSPEEYRSPMALGTAGALLFLCGAWLSIVPVVWPVITGAYFTNASAAVTLQHWLAAASGPGVLLALLGGIALSRAVCSNHAER